MEPRSKSCGQTRLKSPSARFRPRRCTKASRPSTANLPTEAASGFEHRLFEPHGVGERFAAPSVEHCRMRTEPLDHLRRRFARCHEATRKPETNALGEEGDFEAGHDLDIVVRPNDVVAGYEAAKEFVEVWNTAADTVVADGPDRVPRDEIRLMECRPLGWRRTTRPLGGDTDHGDPDTPGALEVAVRARRTSGRGTPASG